jgi:hypothetical protein
LGTFKSVSSGLPGAVLGCSSWYSPAFDTCENAEP